MRALRFSEFGTPSVLQIQDLPEPEILRGQVLVEIHAAAINPSDVKNVQGAMSQTTLPRTPGRDFSGIVVVGPTELMGMHVWGSGGDLGFTRDGSHAEYLLIEQEAIHEKPENLSFAQAATVGVSFATSWSALVETGQVTPQDIVTIIGANGAVGSAAVQIARWLGAFVIGVVRHETHLPYVRQMGAHEVVIGTERMHDRVFEISAGRGASLVFDTVGSEMFESALGLLAHRGRLVEIAATRQRRVSFDLRDFYHREARLFGVDSLQRDVVATGSILEKLKLGFAAGKLVPARIARRYRLDEAVEAYEQVQHGSEGKIVFVMR